MSDKNTRRHHSIFWSSINILHKLIRWTAEKQRTFSAKTSSEFYDHLDKIFVFIYLLIYFILMFI